MTAKGKMYNLDARSDIVGVGRLDSAECAEDCVAPEGVRIGLSSLAMIAIVVLSRSLAQMNEFFQIYSCWGV
jgi:hypothetical protein